MMIKSLLLISFFSFFYFYVNSAEDIEETELYYYGIVIGRERAWSSVVRRGRGVRGAAAALLATARAAAAVSVRSTTPVRHPRARRPPHTAQQQSHPTVLQTDNRLAGMQNHGRPAHGGEHARADEPRRDREPAPS